MLDKIKPMADKLINLESELQMYTDEYNLIVAIRPYVDEDKNVEILYHLLLAPSKEDTQLRDCKEVWGNSIEELRLNFFIKLAELRKRN